MVDTSGYSYKEWLGHFHPEKLPASAMLRYYAAGIAAQGLGWFCVYFMHEDEALGTRFAELLNALWRRNSA